jgi:hypothetical protein
MATESEIIAGAPGQDNPPGTTRTSRRGRNLAEVAVVFAFIMAAVWVPQGPLNAFFSIVAAACVVAFAIAGSWTSREMGLSRPLAGILPIFLVGAALCGIIAVIGSTMKFAGSSYALPLSRSWQYAIWALVQQFILQSIFFLRFESLVGSRRAVFAAASLYAVAHIPSPVLTILSFIGGVIFCELFRRWRNIYPLGIIHAALGLTIAASFPDSWLHHMRVGIGYLTLHR